MVIINETHLILKHRKHSGREMEDENGVEIEVEGENVQFEPKNEDPAFVTDIFQSG